MSASAEKLNQTRMKVIRQERILTNHDNLSIRFDEHNLRIRDYNAFGLSFFTEQDIHKDIEGASLCLNDLEILKVDLKFIRVASSEVEEKYAAFKVISDPIDTCVVAAAEQTATALNKNMYLDKKYNEIPSDFMLTTYQLKEWLSKIEKNINSLGKSSFNNSSDDIDRHESTVCQITARYLEDELYPWFHKLAKSIKNLNSAQMENCFKFFRSQVGEFLFQSYYSHRAYTKPLGYAGDFEMMNTVYENGKRGETLFAKCIHRYFTEVPEAKAVRNRSVYLLKKIKACLKGKKDNVKILVIASGPAKELQDLFANHSDLIPPNAEFHLLDQDEDALVYSQRKLCYLKTKNNINAKLIFHKKSIKNVISEGFDIKNFDLVYSAGLFDYLSDAVASFTAQKLYDLLTDEGQLIIGNFNTDIPNEFGMALIMDWQLIYRSRNELLKLFKNVTNNISIEEEEEGINLFAVFNKDE